MQLQQNAICYEQTVNRQFLSVCFLTVTLMTEGFSAFNKLVHFVMFVRLLLLSTEAKVNLTFIIHKIPKVTHWHITQGCSF